MARSNQPSDRPRKSGSDEARRHRKGRSRSRPNAPAKAEAASPKRAPAGRAQAKAKSGPVQARRPARGAPGGEAAPGRRPLWLFLSEPGLARLLLKELKQKKIVRRNTRAKPLFLRTYDALAIPDVQMTGDVKLSRLSLHTLRCPVFGRDNISNGQLDLLAEVSRAAGADRLVTSLAGSKFDRKELTAWVRGRLADRGVSLSAAEGERLVWLIVVDNAYYFGLPEQNHHEAPGRTFGGPRAGALPGTIAAAMAFAAELKPNDVVWDPMAGSGSLLEEAAAMAPGATLIGSDADADAVADAAGRVPRADFRVGRVEEIALGRSDVTLTLVNPPWEHQFKSGEGQGALLTDLLRASLAVAAPGWRGIVLTPHGDALVAAADAAGGLAARQIANLTVRGLAVGLWRVEPAG